MKPDIVDLQEKLTEQEQELEYWIGEIERAENHAREIKDSRVIEVEEHNITSLLNGNAELLRLQEEQREIVSNRCTTFRKLIHDTATTCIAIAERIELLEGQLNGGIERDLADMEDDARLVDNTVANAVDLIDDPALISKYVSDVVRNREEANSLRELILKRREEIPGELEDLRSTYKSAVGEMTIEQLRELQQL